MDLTKLKIGRRKDKPITKTKAKEGTIVERHYELQSKYSLIDNTDDQGDEELAGQIKMFEVKSCDSCNHCDMSRAGYYCKRHIEWILDPIYDALKCDDFKKIQ